MDLATAIALSGAGMDVQGPRLRVIVGNLANQNTTGSAPGAEPYGKAPNADSGAGRIDLREAERSCSANLSVLQVSRSMLARTIEMLT